MKNPEDIRGDYADEYAGGDSAEEQDREIKEYAKVRNEGGGHQKLTEVMQDTSSHTDTDH